ncbi:uncharacterized protein LOC132283956 [Cornus florida]|uniref:uncharacterized protein LOC132283956 n=1 Tax=Cornus florida TaxID=4283 RepID=UPI0028A1F625|nr:uncharacterized protein LOC132283956 [Cornus florida]
MATLQKFKLLATQCAVAGSPTRSPTTSPVIHLRRRRTLRMFLSRNAGAGHRLPRRDDSPDRQGTVGGDSPEKKSKELIVRHKLKDLFVSSPPFEDRGSDKVGNERELFLPETGRAGGVVGGATGRRGGQRSLRPLSATLRQRLLRRAWRPVLVTIDE